MVYVTRLCNVYRLETSRMSDCRTGADAARKRGVGTDADSEEDATFSLLAIAKRCDVNRWLNLPCACLQACTGESLRRDRVRCWRDRKQRRKLIKLYVVLEHRSRQITSCDVRGFDRVNYSRCL